MKKIHVFASDSLPFPGGPHTAGGQRGLEIISGLRAAGHSVTFSYALDTYLARQWRDEMLRNLSDLDLWCCEHHYDPDVIINRLQPDIAIHCNVNTFRSVRRFARDVVQIVDLSGPVQFEGLLYHSTDPAAAMDDGAELERRCRELTEKLRSVDYVVTVSDRQKYFWTAYCALAGFTFRDLDVLVCPLVFAGPRVPRSPSPEMTVVYSGGFYPWQDPSRFLHAAAEILDGMAGASLDIFGGPHSGMPNEAEVNALLRDLRQHRCVRYHGYRPIEELVTTFATAWCALDVMERNIERELAITGRTLAFLASGTPVIYNNYSTLSPVIERYGAGWTVAPDDPSALHGIFQSLSRGGLTLVEKMSANATRLADAEFNTEKAMAPLVKLCERAVKRTTQPDGRAHRTASKSPELGRVLAISLDSAALVELRANNPLRSLKRQNLIDGFLTTNPCFEKLRDDHSPYEAILIQRSIPEHLYVACVNAGLRYLLDVDDNLLARASYRSAGPEYELLTGLRLAYGLSAPNPRLARMLEKYSGIPLAGRTFITPNALPFPMAAPSREPVQPSRVIWIQSDIAALSDSREAIVRAVEDLSRKYDLPVVLIGRSVLERPAFSRQVVMGEIDFASNLQLLEFGPTSIGVAPLESVGDEETLDFISGKSDLKILLFAGYGHPGVYSNSPPYSDSPLRESGRLVSNSYSDWFDGLEMQYREGWRAISEHERFIHEERHIDRISREAWAPALQACALPKPVQGRELYELFQSCRTMDPSSGRALAYLTANADVGFNYVSDEITPWDHFEQFGRAELRPLVHDPRAQEELIAKLSKESNRLFAKGESGFTEIRRRIEESRNAAAREEIQRLQAEVSELRNSLSWKITYPLRVLAKPLMAGRAQKEHHRGEP